MIRIIFLFFLVMVFTAGCAAEYSYRFIDGEIEMLINKPDTEKLFFLSSLDGFKRHELSKNDKDTWKVMLPADKAFRFFLVADENIFLPDCRFRESDGFGSENCVYIPE